jgi:MFS family permease
LSDDRVFALGSILVATSLLAYALVHSTAPAFAASVVAGLGWLLCLSTLNVASQEALPGWVRARGLAFCLTALSAGVAVGSVVWGKIANAAGVPATYAWGALALVVTLALALRWRFDTIARLDLSPSPMAAPEGRLVGVEDAGSPALVVVGYEVRPECEDDFLRALRLVGRVRRRNGAVSWSFYRDADRTHRFIESFVLPTWDEHVRQHQRLTVTDEEVLAKVREFLRAGTAPEAEHYVQPPEPPLMIWPR